MAEPVPVLLGLGGNVGDRLAHIEAALERLSAACGPFRRSSVYETPPWGDVDQGPFLNLVVEGRTGLPLDALLRLAKDTEVAVGRAPTRRWGPRVVDVDILAYGDAQVAEPDLEVPHARLHERGFVLVPLVEIAPHWRHPRLGRSATELLAALPASETEAISRWPDPPGASPYGTSSTR